MMRKLLAGGMAALTLAGGVLAPVAEAQARDYRHYHRYHRHRDNDGAALAAGIAGLAIGAALASNSNRGYGYRSYGYYDAPRGYYGRSYYGPGYYRPYGYGYDRPRNCRTTSFYDDWDGRYVERTRCW